MSTPVEALRWLVRREPWMDKSACRGLDPNLFQMEQGQSSANARTICQQCEVVDACAEYAERTGSVGVWGNEVRTLKSRTVTPITAITDSRPVKLRPPTRRRQGSSSGAGQIAARRAQ